jgi:hypothetical protein
LLNTRRIVQAVGKDLLAVLWRFSVYLSSYFVILQCYILRRG